MSDGQYKATSAVSSVGIAKGLSTGILTNGYGMAPMPQLFYKLMLGSEYEQESIMRHIQTEVLEAAIEFVQDLELKRKMYNSIRRRIFTGGNRSQSIIINELVGMYGFVKKAIEYGILTVKMHMDK